MGGSGTNGYKKGAFLHGRLIAGGGKGISVRQLGGGRAGEMRIARFLHNRKVTVDEMVARAKERTCEKARGRHILAIQDTTALRMDEKNIGVALHPVIAVDADDGTLLGLIDNAFFARKGGGRASRKQRVLEEKESRRWLLGAESASALAEAGAASVTVIEDREGDIYESFACRPAGVDLLVRAAQDRALAGGGRLFAKADGWAGAGRMSVDLAAIPRSSSTPCGSAPLNPRSSSAPCGSAPLNPRSSSTPCGSASLKGRKARTAVLCLRFGAVEIKRPCWRKRGGPSLPETVTLSFVESERLS